MNKQDFDYSSAAASFTEERSVWKQIGDSICTELLPNRKNWFCAVRINWGSSSTFTDDVRSFLFS